MRNSNNNRWNHDILYIDMKQRNTILTVIWSCIVLILMGICAYEYSTLAYNLHSVYDEGFFYVTTVFIHKTVASTQPLTLAMDFINALIPCIEQYDVLALRQYGFCAKGVALLFLISCSCLFLYKKYSENRAHIYLALISSYLLVGTLLLPGEIFNMNDIILIWSTLAFSFYLLYAAASNQILKYAIIVSIGILAFFTLLCNLPAGCMLILLSFVFLLNHNGCTIKNRLQIILYGLVGLIIGIIITHFCIITMHDCLDFLQKGIAQTSGGGRASHHSITKIVYVILLGFRDLTITTLLLCGITYICKIVQEKFNKSWLTIASLLVLFFVAYKWQVKPEITIASALCWLTIIFLYYHSKFTELSRSEILLILISFIMPIGLVFGTDTSIIEKALLCGTPWGFLLFYLYYLARPELRKYAISGMVIVACCMLSQMQLQYSANGGAELRFEAEKPISRMNLRAVQKAFYDEIYDVLTAHGYNAQSDTLLGFCFNEMTVVAMDAVPYTNDQQPVEFLSHDLNNMPCPKYMILSEWDSVVLYDRLSELDWDFPYGYDYYKCVNNPDPDSGYGMTQSMIYCKKK